MARIRSHCGGFTQTNGYLVESASGVLVAIDAPAGMAEWLREQGLSPAVQLLTHAHFDHVVDAALIQESFSCPLYAFERPNPDLTLETAYTGMGMSVRPYHVDEFIRPGTQIEAGDLCFECLHVPGHSPDSVCFFLPARDVVDRPQLFGGDVLFQGSIGRTDFPHGDHEALIRGIREQLFVLPDDTIIYAGHGPATTIGVEKLTNPYVRVRD